MLSKKLDTILPWLEGYGVSEIILLVCLIFLAFLLNLTVKLIISKVLHVVIEKTANTKDDVLLEFKVFEKLSHVAPALLIYSSVYFILEQDSKLLVIIERLALVYIILAIFRSVSSALNAAHQIYLHYDVSRHTPIKSYVQVIKIFLGLTLLILSLSILLNKSPWGFLSGLGAMSAILMLVFKDSLMSFVAGIQLSTQNMVQIGDWIEIPAQGVDGDVIEVSLNAIKVRNFDKTIVTIPPYLLVSGSFKNWRGMQESGGRRIKRSINIDLQSIKFCDEALLKKFKSFQYISEYITEKEKEIAEHNAALPYQISNLIDGRRLTNIGVFREYLHCYLRQHKGLHQKNMTLMVRQLPSSSEGLPLEIYVFANDTNWENYEAIQADIFDHIFAAIRHFDLQLFQNVSGSDLREAINKYPLTDSSMRGKA